MSDSTCFICFAELHQINLGKFESPTSTAATSDAGEVFSSTSQPSSTTTSDYSLSLVQLLNNNNISERCNTCVLNCGHNNDQHTNSKIELKYFQEKLEIVQYCQNCIMTFHEFNAIVHQLKDLEQQMNSLRDSVLGKIQTAHQNSGKGAHAELLHLQPFTSAAEVNGDLNRQILRKDIFENFRRGNLNIREKQLEFNFPELHIKSEPVRKIEKDPTSAYVKLIPLEKLPLATKFGYVPGDAVQIFHHDNDTDDGFNIEVSHSSDSESCRLENAEAKNGTLKLRRFKCSICCKGFTRRSTLRNHAMKKHGIADTFPLRNKPFNCTSCDASLTTKSTLERHMLKQHGINVKRGNVNKRFTCPICGSGFTSKTSLRRHKLKQHQIEHVGGDDIKRFTCPVCGSAFKAKSTLIRHKLKQHQIIESDAERLKRKLFHCTLCNLSVTALASLERHQLNKHGVNLTRSWRCEQEDCNRTFKTSTGLATHRKLSHHIQDAVKKEYKCDECGKCLRSKTNLKNHKDSHLSLRPFMCEICSRTFTSMVNLKHHQTKHPELNLKTFKCELCDTIFSNPYYLRTHMKTQHLNQFRFKCEVESCEYKSWTNSKLQIHISNTHKQEKNWACDQCPSKYATKASLVVHTRTHTGERPYVCKICGNSFFQSSRLSRHMQIHINDRKHACPHCDKRFAVKNNLWWHLRSHETKEERTARKMKTLGNRQIKATLCV